MGIPSVRKLCWEWFPQENREFASALNEVFDQIGFTDEFVTDSIASCSARRATKKSKVIKDNVWGMVDVDWQSVRLLDSPVVQRLRGICQLGFTYLTYPSAEHSRFAHSLGMYCVVSRFLNEMDRKRESNAEPFERWPVPDQDRTDLLHAAILHDVGHMAFSHVSERIFYSFKTEFRCGPFKIEDFIFAVEEHLSKPLSLSECLSLAVVLSPRFQRFYTEFVRPDAGIEAPLRVAALIAGIAPVVEHRGIAELISDTAVDADKVDYINRDSAACGIPVGIDVARLFLRSAFVKVDPDQMLKLRPNKA